jgi:hypothetical protein
MSPLDNLSVAAPCQASWEAMTGDARVRFCGQCQKNVYNLSTMTTADAEALLLKTEGRLCVRFYRRKDGTVLTENCPVGLAALRRRVVLAGAAVAAFFSLAAGGLFGWRDRGDAKPSTGVRLTCDPSRPFQGDVSMGAPPPLTRRVTPPTTGTTATGGN